MAIRQASAINKLAVFYITRYLRMAKRFNNLDAALKYLRSTSAAEDAVTPDAPAGSQLKRYQDFVAGKIRVEYTRATTSNQIALDEVALLPFSNPSASTEKYLVDVSRRAKNRIADAGIDIGILNISDTLTGASRVYGFTPARATVRNVTGTTATLKDSKITGAPYKSKAASSFTFPFGSQAANGSYSEIRNAIIAAVGASGNRSVSFKPEVIR